MSDDYLDKMCPKCREPHGLYFMFSDGTYECECGAEGPLSDLVPKPAEEGDGMTRLLLALGAVIAIFGQLAFDPVRGLFVTLAGLGVVQCGVAVLVAGFLTQKRESVLVSDTETQPKEGE